MGEAGSSIVGWVRGEISRLAARGRDQIDIALIFAPGLEDDRSAVWGPPRSATVQTHGGELKGIGPVRIGQPDFPVSRSIRCKCHAAAIRRKVRRGVSSR